MILTKLDVKGFGRFENRKYCFGPGLNVVYGCNESGKSTLQSFIKGMFFGLKGGRKAKDGSLPPARRFKPWIAAVYGGVMEYELDSGRRYSVTRNFDRNTISIHDGYNNNITGEFSAEKEEGVRFAEQHMGLSERCFERTAFIGQLQSFVDNEGRKVLAEKFMNIRQGGAEEVSYQKALKALKDAQLSYVGSERSTTRPLNLIQARLDETVREEEAIQRLYENGRDTFSELEQERKKENILEIQRGSLLEKRKRIKENMEILESCKKIQKLKQYLIQIQEIESSKNENENILKQLDKSMESVRSFSDFTRDDADRMVSDHIRFELKQREYREVLNEKERNEEKLACARQVLDQYNFFSENELLVEKVLNKILNEENKRVEKAETEGGKIKPLLHKALKKISLIVMGVAVFLISAGLFFRTKISSELFMAFIIAGLFIILSSIGIFFLAGRKEKKSMNINCRIDAELHESVMEFDSRRLLNEWMEKVKVVNLQDFIRLRSLFEDKRRLYKELQAENTRIRENEKNLLSFLNDIGNRISEKLRKARIPLESDAIRDEYIQSWRKGFEEYLSIFQKQQAIRGNNGSLSQKEEGIYREISLTCNEEITTRMMLEELIDRESEHYRPQDHQGTEEADLVRLEEDIELINDRIRENHLNINTLTIRLENIPDEEKLQEIHEKLQVLTDEKEDIVFTGKALDEAMKALTEASIEVRRDYVPCLSREMGDIMSKVTGGKYSEVKADDSLLLNILPPDSLEWVMPEQLSSGTVDQVYLALRLASVKLVEKEDERLPLFLDEPFVQYDEERTKNALSLLAEECKTRQILLFTCKQREVELIHETFDPDLFHTIKLEKT